MNFPYSLLRLIGMKPLGFERLRYRWYPTLSRVLHRPICAIIGHHTYDSDGWEGGYTKCTRCDWWNCRWKPSTSTDGGKTYQPKPISQYKQRGLLSIIKELHSRSPIF